ncbi:DUF3592 domain-containing protein [Streptomyces sp. NPDC052042]|uniref:DUF3592 domain-containing protein n=1 Tax=Streptomyces sp. NPDC052042 TaxID=3365683 RepID=UPI0037D5FB49
MIFAEIFLMVLLILASLFMASIGGYLAYLQWRHRKFIRSGQMETTRGECVNLRWTPGGLVASGIRYVDKEGRRRVAWTRAQSTIPVGIGEKAQVSYDPKGKTTALVNGVSQGTGSYGVAAGFFVLAAILLFNAFRDV